MSDGRHRGLIFGAAFLRSLGVGLIGVLLGIFLFRIGFSTTQIGLTIGAGLAGSAAATAWVSLRADRFGRRRTLLLLSALSAAAGLGLVLFSRAALLIPCAFLGMLNAMGSDRGPAFALEQALLPAIVPGDRRTWTLSWYNVVLDCGHALGALGAALPLLLGRWLGADLLAAYRLVFAGYFLLHISSGVLYLLLGPSVEAPAPAAGSAAAPLSPRTKSIVARLAALSGLDSFGGGFLTDALIAFWFFRRFGVPEQSLGVLFFFVHALNSVSYLGAAWLARRIGLLRTMVFTHLPSSLFLLALPFAPSLSWCIALFLARETLVEMDVPARQSYIAAVVAPSELTLASGMTNLTRNVSWAAASSVAGFVMQYLSLAAPLLFGGGAKIVYDLLLYRAFRHLRPPEEMPGSPGLPRIVPAR